MLFDLRGRGRRRTVQAVYLFLAILIGGGLIFFGVGTGTNSGGLLNAVNQNGGSANGNLYNQQVTAANKQIKLQPKSPAGYLALTKAKFALASASGYDTTNNTYTDQGKLILAQARDAWDKYLALNPSTPDVDTANEMASALLLTNQFTDAANAQEIVTMANPTIANDWFKLAAYSYYAGQKDKGDQAAARALALAPKAQVAQMRTQLTSLRKTGQAAAAQAQSGLSSQPAQLPTF